MRGRSALPTVNQSVGQRYGTTVGKRWVALREYQGKDANGALAGPAIYHDFHTNRTVHAGEQWEIPPPDLPSGDQGRLPSYLPPSAAYRQHYEKIDWSQ